MTTRTALIAALVAIVAVPAMADTSRGVTREQVRAEYLRAAKAGELDFAREFVSAPTASRQSGTESAAANTRIEDLAPTAAGTHDVAARNVPAAKSAQ